MISREEYEKQLKSWIQKENPKPTWEERERLLAEYERPKKARIRTQRMLKELNAGLMKEIMAGK